MKVRILLTCIGGHYSYDIVDALRRAGDFSVFLVGVDSNPKARAWHIDAFAVVPRAELAPEAYVMRILELCLKYKIDVVIPLSEGESRVIAAARHRFLECGITTSVSAAEVVLRMTDKGTMFEYLQKKGIDVGPWRFVDAHDEAEDALRELGYPDHPVVLKQRRGSGSRGVFIVDAGMPTFIPLLPDRFCGRGAWDAIVGAVAGVQSSFDTYLAMPYYGSDIFDVDCLAQAGEAVTIVPRLRQYTNPLSPVNEGCRVERNEQIERYVMSLTRAFGVEGACDFDIAMSDDGAPRLLDASCRLSGSVGAAVAAGVNVPAQLVRLLKNMPLVPSALVSSVEMRPVPRFVPVPLIDYGD